MVRQLLLLLLVQALAVVVAVVAVALIIVSILCLVFCALHARKSNKYDVHVFLHQYMHLYSVSAPGQGGPLAFENCMTKSRLFLRSTIF